MLFFPENFPVLDLDEIILREITEQDGEDYFLYMNNNLMKGFLTDDNTPKNIESAANDLRYWSSLFKNKRSIYWAIALKDNNKIIGTAGFNTLSPTNFRGDISYDLDPNYWSRGLMLKSVKSILKFTDLNMGLIRIQATVIIDNERSIKLLERCGFHNEGLLKKYEIVQSEFKDYYMYARVL